MVERFTRRRFGQMVVGSTAVLGASFLASKTIAQSPSLVVVGVSTAAGFTRNEKSSEAVDVTRPEVQAPAGAVDAVENSPQVEAPGTVDVTRSQVEAPARAVDAVENIPVVDTSQVPISESPEADSKLAPVTSRGVVLQSFDLVNGQLQDGGATSVNLNAGDRITGLTYLASSDALIAAITPDATGVNGAKPTRIAFLGTSKTVDVTGLKPSEALESLLLLNDGSFVALKKNKNGSPPVTLVDVNPNTGEISDKGRVKLPADTQFSNLAQCPDGTLYTTAYRRNGDTELVQLNLGQGTANVVVKLTVNGAQWNNGLIGLVCTSSGQLLGLGNLRYRAPSALWTIDVKSGAMSKLRDTNFSEIATRPVASAAK